MTEIPSNKRAVCVAGSLEPYLPPPPRKDDDRSRGDDERNEHDAYFRALVALFPDMEYRQQPESRVDISCIVLHFFASPSGLVSVAAQDAYSPTGALWHGQTTFRLPPGRSREQILGAGVEGLTGYPLVDGEVAAPSGAIDVDAVISPYLVHPAGSDLMLEAHIAGGCDDTSSADERRVETRVLLKSPIRASRTGRAGTLVREVTDLSLIATVAPDGLVIASAHDTDSANGQWWSHDSAFYVADPQAPAPEIVRRSLYALTGYELLPGELALPQEKGLKVANATIGQALWSDMQQRAAAAGRRRRHTIVVMACVAVVAVLARFCI